MIGAHRNLIGLTSTNDALSISLVAPSKSGPQSVATFYPRFTYPIFGEEEEVFGYKGLKMSLRYRANDMRPHFEVTYAKKSKPVGGKEPHDINAILQRGNHLPRSRRCLHMCFKAGSANSILQLPSCGRLISMTAQNKLI
jgi:hypothetical protein